MCVHVCVLDHFRNMLVLCINFVSDNIFVIFNVIVLLLGVPKSSPEGI